MHIYNKIHILLAFLLHVSALIAQSSKRTIHMSGTIATFVATLVSNFCTVTLKRNMFFNLELETSGPSVKHFKIVLRILFLNYKHL